MRTTRAKTPLATYMFGLRPGSFTLVALLGAGGKPSTWLPPGELADLLNNYVVRVLSLHAHVCFCVHSQFLLHMVMSKKLCNISLAFPGVCPSRTAAFLGCILIFP